MSVQQLQPATDGSYNNRGPVMYARHAPQAQAARASQTQSGTYQAPGASHNDIGIQSMIGSFAQTHISAPNGTIPAASNTIPAVNTPQYFFTQEGQIFCMPSANIYSTQPVATAHLQDGGYAAYPGLAYASQTGYPGYMPGYAMMSYTQARQGHMSERQGAMHKEVPGLDNRRGSYSTNESAPGTPFYGSLGHGDHGTVIATVDRSPIYSTPSPQIPQNVNMPQAGKPLPYKAISANYNVAAVDEIIPDAIPAVFTPRESMRTLEQSLSNPIYGNRNVYIRGLQPDTNDETLAAYASLFGRVETSKAIIDTGTGTCKG